MSFGMFWSIPVKNNAQSAAMITQSVMIMTVVSVLGTGFTSF